MLDLLMPNYATFKSTAKGGTAQVYFSPRTNAADGGLAAPFACAASLTNGDTLRWIQPVSTPDAPSTFNSDFPQAIQVNAGLV